MITPLTQTGEMRDWWGSSYARIASRLLSLGLQPTCYRMRIYSTPPQEDRVIPQNGYLRSTMAVTPGSFILGIMRATDNNRFFFQVTDVALGHKWFSDPVPSGFFEKPFVSNAFPAHLSQLPWLFEAPYPVPAGGGLFLWEFWNDTTISQGAEFVQVYLLVAEPRCNANG
jgi:hypothetical protein